MDAILFLLFAAIAVICAINLVLQKHPISSALSLVGVMGSLAVLYLLLGGEFIAAAQLVVYAGAIMVLFVFVIMLLNAGEEEHTSGSTVAWLLGIPGLLTGAVLICWAVLRYSGSGSVSLGALPGPPKDIAQLLFHEFLLPFEVTSILVLIAIMGAVVLAARPESVQESKREG
jgi:NADH-quinone oxidoreductase subunit J